MITNDSLLEQVDILVERGLFVNREALLRDAIRALLRSRPELRQQFGIELYNAGETSLARAAEISGVDLETFKELLREAGVVRTVTPVGEAIHDEVDRIVHLQEIDHQNEDSH